MITFDKTLILLLAMSLGTLRAQEELPEEPVPPKLVGWRTTGSVTGSPGLPGQALEARGFGLAVWNGRLPSSFVLSFRYRHAPGTGDIVLYSGVLRQARLVHHLQFRDEAMVLLEEAEGVETQVARTAFRFVPGHWYRVRIDKAPDGLRVNVDDALLLSTTRRIELTGDRLALGAFAGRGMAFADASLARRVADPGRTGSLFSILDPDVRARLERANVRDADALVRELQSRSSMESLAQRAGVPSDRLLMAGQELELAAALGLSTREAVLLLGRAGIKRPEDLARASGREKALRAHLAGLAARHGMQAPALEGVSSWVARAASTRSRLPAVRNLAMEEPPKRAPSAARLITLPGDLRRKLRVGEPGSASRTEVASTPRANIPGGLQVATPTAATSAANILIRAETTAGAPFIHEFQVAQPGLHRIDISLRRQGGVAKLRWFVDRPNVRLDLPGTRRLTGSALSAGTVFDPPTASLKVASWAPLVSGKELLATNPAAKPAPGCLYFWIWPGQLPLNGRLRLRLEVVENEDFRSDPIEQSTHPGPGDPTITGQVAVHWQRTIKARLDATTGFPLSGAFDQQRGDFPLQVVECVYQPAMEIWGRWTTSSGQICTISQQGTSFEIRLPESGATGKGVAAGTELRWARIDAVGDRTVVKGRVTQLSPGGKALRIEWEGGLVLARSADAAPLVGQAPWELLVTSRTNDGRMRTPTEITRDGSPVGRPRPDGPWIIDSPPMGIYRMVFPAGTLRELETTGIVKGVSPRAGGITWTVSIKPSNGAPPKHHVVEVLDLAVSDQAEDDKTFGDADDDGPGEFQLEASVFLMKTPGSAGNAEEAIDHFYGQQLGSTTVRRTWPEWPNARTEIPTVKESGEEHHRCFPRWLLGCWEEGELERYDAMLASLLVVERDSASWWQTHAGFINVVKNIVETIKAVYTLDLSSLGSALMGLKSIGTGVVKHVQDQLGTYEIGSKDDVMGYMSFSTSKVRGFGLPGPETFKDPKEYRAFYPFTVEGSPEPGKMAYTEVVDLSRVSRASVSKNSGSKRWARATLMHRSVQALYASVGVQITSFTLGEDVDDPGDPAEIYYTLEPPRSKYASWWSVEQMIQSERFNNPYSDKHGVAIDDSHFVMVDSIYSARTGQRFDIVHKGVPLTAREPGYTPVSAFYIEAGFFDEDPGKDQLVSRFTHTFYLEDFLRDRGRRGEFKPRDGGRTWVNYFKQGDYHIGDFIFKNPGGSLSELRMRVYARIWEGR